MRDVLIDVRCLQDPEHAASWAGRQALALLRRARAELPGAALIGLVDGSREVPETVRALLDAVRRTAYTGAMRRPACLVQLSPAADDPLAVARALLHPAIPAVTIAAPPARPPGSPPARAVEAVRRHWAGRYDRELMPGPGFWAEVDALAPARAPAAVTGKRAAVAVLAPPLPDEADRALCSALRGLVELEVFTPGPDQPLGAMPLFAPRFDRVISLIGNTPGHVYGVQAVARFGGAALVRDSCLLAPYRDDARRLRALGEGELGRAVPREEVRRWLAGEIGPPPLLGEVAASAEPIITSSLALAREIRSRYEREAAVIPFPVPPLPARPPRPRRAELRIAAAGGAGAACVWALETLWSWGVRARMTLVGKESPDLCALSRELGMAAYVAFAPDMVEADVVVLASMRGQASLTAALAGVAARGLPCVASASIVEGLDAPAWVCPVPDEPSPVRIAEAVLAASESEPDPVAAGDFRRRHDPGRCARLLCEVLGLGA